MGILNFIHNSMSSKNVRDKQKQLISTLCSINPAFKVFVESENEVILKNSDSDTEIKLEQFFYSKDAPLYVSCSTKDNGDTIGFTIEYKEPVVPSKVIKDLTETLAKKHSELEAQRNTYPLSNQEQEQLLALYTLRILKEGSSENSWITEGEHYVRDSLNTQQARALFGTIVSLCYPYYISTHRHKLILELANYAYILSIGINDLKYCYSHQSSQDAANYIRIIKEIKDDNVLIHFIKECIKIDKIENIEDTLHTILFCLLNDVGYTDSEIEIISSGGFVYKNYSSSDNGQNLTGNEITILIPLLSFKRIHGNLGVGCIVDNETGDYEDVCIFTNNKGKKIYIGFSPYFGNISLEEIIEEGNDLFVQYNYKEGCFFLCTKESNEYRMENLDEFCYLEEERCLEQMLTNLNVNNSIEKYTISE